MSRVSRAALATGYILALAVLAVDAVLVAISLGTISRNNGLVDHTRRVIDGLDGSLAALRDAETGQRGYLLTGRESYLEPFQTAEAALERSLLSLRSEGHDDARKAAEVAELVRTTSEKMAELRQTIALRREKGPDAALAVVLSDRGKEAMDRARRIVGDIREAEGHRLAARVEESRGAVRSAIGTFVATTMMALALLVAVGYLQRLDLIERDRAAEAIHQERTWLATTLASIGDAVIATDERGRVRFLNPVAEALTGWSQAEAAGRPMGEVFRIVNEQTRQAAESPVDRVLREGVVVGLANHTILIARDGRETPIDDSAAPIRAGSGAIAGVVLVFRDISERKRREEESEEQRRLAEFGRDMGLALTESATFRAMLDRCAEVTVGHLNGAFSRIWTLDKAGDTLELQASAGLYTHIDGPHARVPVGRFKIGLIAQERRPHLSNDVGNDARVSNPDWAVREGMVAFAGYPLVVEGRLIGVWAMFARHALSEATLRAMESVAYAIGSGIERKRAEEEAEAERRWLATTLASIGDAVIATDERGRVRFLNPVAEALTGWAQAEARGRPMGQVFRIVNEQTRKSAENPVEQVLREGRVVGLANHTILIGRNGTEWPIEDSAAPIKGPLGEVLGVVMVFHDVAEKRGRERAILASEALKGAILESALDSIITMDGLGRAVEFNPAAEATFGYSRDEAIGQTIEELIIPPELREMHRRGLARFHETGDGPVIGRRIEIEARRADGSRFPVELAIVPIRQGGERLFTAYLRDLTERKRHEAEREALLAAERVARAEAEEADRAKAQFLAVLSHELRTPLNPILLAVTAMLERPTSVDDLRPNLEMIKRYVGLEARLIDDLLDVMRIVRGKMPLHWEVADAHALIQEAVQICRSDVFGGELRLSLHLDAADHHINADPARLQQVFWNLQKNAVKFTPVGGELCVRTRNEAVGGSERLVIEVADTGIGIEPDVLPVIFDPFQQGESTITRRFGGLGLGLAICKGIVEGHGGTIRAESAGHGKGTTFIIELGALPAPKAEGPKDGSAAPAVCGESKPLRILLVEDEQATSRLLARLLAGLGHRVETAGTIAGALGAEAECPFDLIISDIGLPDGSGLELIRQVVARRGTVPAIALTGYGMEEDIQRSRMAGFTAHMTKPIDFTKLEAMIRQVSP